MKSCGQIAYEAYMDAMGERLPSIQWEELPDADRAAWDAAGEAVLDDAFVNEEESC